MMLSSPASTFLHLSLTLSAISERPRTQAAVHVAPALKSSGTHPEIDVVYMASQDEGRLSIRGMKDARETMVAVEVDARANASTVARNGAGSIVTCRVGM